MFRVHSTPGDHPRGDQETVQDRLGDPSHRPHPASRGEGAFRMSISKHVLIFHVSFCLRCGEYFFDTSPSTLTRLHRATPCIRRGRPASRRVCTTSGPSQQRRRYLSLSLFDTGMRTPLQSTPSASLVQLDTARMRAGCITRTNSICNCKHTNMYSNTSVALSYVPPLRSIIPAVRHPRRTSSSEPNPHSLEQDLPPPTRTDAR